MNEWEKKRKREMIHEDCVRVKSKFVKGNYYIRKSGVKEKIWKLRRNRERENSLELATKNDNFLLKHVGGQTRGTNFVPLRLVRIHFVSPVFTNPNLSFRIIASQPTTLPSISFPRLLVCTRPLMCIRMLPAQLLFICAEEMHDSTILLPLLSKQTEREGGLLRQWKSPGCVPVLVLILHFSPLSFFSFF